MSKMDISATVITAVSSITYAKALGIILFINQRITITPLIESWKFFCSEFEVKSFDFEYWDSFESRYVIISIKAESEKDAVTEFKNRHPHKKYRLLDDLDE